MARPPEDIQHGTVSGYMKEWRRGLPRCRACLDAMNERNKKNREKARGR